MLEKLKSNWQSFLFLFLLCWMLGAPAYRGATNPDSGITGIDFAIYYQAAQWLNDGAKLYPPPEQSSYMYTPLVAWACKPLARMPYASALQIWSVMNVAALFVAAGLFALAARIRSLDALRMGLLLIIAFRFWPTVCNLGLGQVNCILLALLAGIVLAETRGRMVIVAVLIAMAAMIKLWMIGFILHLAVRRAWGAVVCCCGVFVALLATSFALIGWHEWPGFCAKIASPSSSLMPSIVSQSIPGFARLRFAENPLVEPFTTNPVAYQGFVAVGYLAIAMALAWLWWVGPARSPYEMRVRTGFTMLSVVLLLPICHMEYFILAVPLLWALLATAPGDHVRAGTIVPAILIYIVFTRPVPVSGPGLAAHHDGLRSLLVSQPFFAACALWLVALVEICRVRSAHRPGTASQSPVASLSQPAVAA